MEKWKPLQKKYLKNSYVDVDTGEYFTKEQMRNKIIKEVSREKNIRKDHENNRIIESSTIGFVIVATQLELF